MTDELGQELERLSPDIDVPAAHSLFRDRVASRHRQRRFVAAGAAALLIVGVTGTFLALRSNPATSPRVNGPVPTAGNSAPSSASTAVATLPSPTMTAAPTSTSAAPKPTIDSLAVGESVMQGAQTALSQNGVQVIANESVQGRGIIDTIRAARAEYDITQSVVIQSGTNGPVSQAEYDEMATVLADVPHVYFLTIKAPLAWVAGNNEIIRSLPATHPNVTILDWETLGQQIESELSAADGGIHLNTQAAVRAYANLILGALGKPLIPDS